MRRFLKSISIIFTFSLLIGVIGCGTANSSNSSSNETAKAAVVKKEQVKNKQTDLSSSGKKTAAGAVKKGASSSPANHSQKANTSAAPKNTASATTSPKPSQSNSASEKSTATKSVVTAAASTPAKKTSTNQPSGQTVKISIIDPYVKPDGTLMNGGTKTVNIQKGDTVLTVLLKAAGGNNVDYSGSGASSYVSGIDNIYEFDDGPKSGWTFTVNGVEATRSAGAIQVQAGNTIKWIYVKDYTVNR